jgi:hypothetical protein
MNLFDCPECGWVTAHYSHCKLGDGLRMCKDCKFDIEIDLPTPCGPGNHSWHKPFDDSNDMCCKCGLDVDGLWK